MKANNDWEWQIMKPGHWVFGKKVRGLVRDAMGEVTKTDFCFKWTCWRRGGTCCEGLEDTFEEAVNAVEAELLGEDKR